MRMKTITFATLLVGFADIALSATPTTRPTRRRKRSPPPTQNNSIQLVGSSSIASAAISGANETISPACALADITKCGCQEVAQADYRGSISITENGYTCKEWTFFGSYNWPDHGLEYNNNCRNPNQANTRAWCFVMESNVIWDFCDVPYCDEYVKPEETGESSSVVNASNLPSFKPSTKRTVYPTVEVSKKQVCLLALRLHSLTFLTIHHIFEFTASNTKTHSTPFKTSDGKPHIYHGLSILSLCTINNTIISLRIKLI